MANLTKEEMTSLISNVFEEMLPEFTVMTNIQVFKQEGVAAYTHQIFKIGEYPPLDKAAHENKGCWQQCVAITP